MLYEELDDRFGRRKKRTVIFGMAGGTPPTPPTPPTPSVLEEKDLNFYDFEGTLVASYDADEIAGLTELPEAPDHSADEVPLTFEGWNWTLEDIQGYFVSVPNAIVDVGATYHPTDGKTHAFFVIENDNDLSGVYLRLRGPATVDWGDGDTSTVSSAFTTLSHVYTRKGRYHCVIEGSNNNLDFTEYYTYAMNNSKVTEIYVSNSQTSLTSQFACEAYNLEKVTIPSSVTTIDAYCLSYTSRLRTCILPRGVTDIVFNALAGSGIEKVSLPSTLTKIQSSAFNSSKLLRITLPPRLETIEVNAFQYCRSLRTLSWGDSVLSIGNRAFEEANLIEVRMPANVSSLGTHIFRGALSLRKVTLSDTMTTIPQSMLSSCDSLQKADIPASVTEIAGSVFGGSSYSLSVIRVFPTTPPTLGTSVFTTNIKKIYVPAESVEAYKSATNWSNYAEKIEAIPA